MKNLLDIPEKIFKLHIKSSDIWPKCTNGDGLCAFRALRQASKRAIIPVQFRDTKPIRDVYYITSKNGTSKYAWQKQL